MFFQREPGWEDVRRRDRNGAYFAVPGRASLGHRFRRKPGHKNRGLMRGGVSTSKRSKQMGLVDKGERFGIAKSLMFDMNSKRKKFEGNAANLRRYSNSWGAAPDLNFVIRRAQEKRARLKNRKESSS